MIYANIIHSDKPFMGSMAGAAGALVMGVIFAAGWSPCVGPVLGSILTYTATEATSPAEGAFYLSMYGAGFALPLFSHRNHIGVSLWCKSR
mgnify:CR=1 FL=1